MECRLFPPALIEPLGSFQDGGLRHNNPADLAILESLCIWPSITEPDVVLSLGTGTDSFAHSPKVTHARHILKDGFVPRVYRAFRSSLDGEIAWRALRSRLNDRTRQNYFRLNVVYPGPEPAIDDVDSMDDLSALVKTQPSGAQERLEVFSALLVSSLFFELDDIPVYTDGLYWCRGSIRCRSGCHVLLTALKTMYGDCPEYYKNHESLGRSLSVADICGNCRRYRCDVAFSVLTLERPFTLSLRGAGFAGRSLSAMPHSPAWFIQAQGLHRPFGSANHGVPGRILCDACKPRREAPIVRVNRFKRKREDAVYQPPARQKRIRTVPPR